MRRGNRDRYRERGAEIGIFGTLGEMRTQVWGDGDKNQVLETEVWEMGPKED